MTPYTVTLIANSECEMREAKAAAISDAIRAVRAGQCAAPARPAAITISLECWRDDNGKLHCKLSVSFGAA